MNINQMMWEQFEELFCERYLPLVLRDRKTAEFFNLSQDTMLVNEYVVKFTSLLRYVPNLDEKVKAQCFENGLCRHLCHELPSNPNRTYQDLVIVAYLIESYRAQSNRRRNNSGNSSYNRIS